MTVRYVSYLFLFGSLDVGSPKDARSMMLGSAITEYAIACPEAVQTTQHLHSYNVV